MTQRKFSIRSLQNLSGIQPHTIRMWEKRHQLFTPQRSEGNTRSYSIEDVRRLLFVALLVKNGYTISAVAKMDIATMEDRISNLAWNDVKWAAMVNQLIYFMYTARIEEFEEVLDSGLHSFELHEIIQHVIIPFLRKASLLSYTDTSIEAHFAITAVRKKIILGIENLTPVSTAKPVLLFLPKGQHYDLMLLYMTYLIRRQGYRTLYLGTDITLANLDIVLQNKQSNVAFTYLTTKYVFDAAAYSSIISEVASHATLYIVSEDNRHNSEPGIDNVRFINLEDIGKVLGQSRVM